VYYLTILDYFCLVIKWQDYKGFDYIACGVYLLSLLKKRYETGKRRHGRPHKFYIFLISIRSRVDIAVSVCLSV